MKIYIWLGIIGLVCLLIAVLLIVIAVKKKEKVLRPYHVILGSFSAGVLLTHGSWVIIPQFTQGVSLSPFKLMGLAALLLLCLAIGLISYGKKYKNWRIRKLHPEVGLIVVLLGISHGIWALIKILT